jgi:hypothetical protein
MDYTGATNWAQRRVCWGKLVLNFKTESHKYLSELFSFRGFIASIDMCSKFLHGFTKGIKFGIGQNVDKVVANTCYM